MGQKVNPNGMRYGINRDWNSRWYAGNNNFADYLLEDLAIREKVAKFLDEKGSLLSHIEIDRATKSNGMELVIKIFDGRPGVIFGQENQNLAALKKLLTKIVKSTSNFRIEVVKIEKVDLDATLLAKWIAHELENRASFRSVQKKAIARARKAGAKGCRTLVSGRLGGADIARGEGYKEGIIPLHTLRSDIDYAHVEAHTTYGRLGVKVWICRGEYPMKKRNNSAKGDNE